MAVPCGHHLWGTEKNDRYVKKLAYIVMGIYLFHFLSYLLFIIQIFDTMLLPGDTVTQKNLKVKVKVALVQALRLCIGRTAHRGSRGIALPFFNHGTRRGDGTASRPRRSLSPGKKRYPLHRRLGGPQGRSGQVRKIPGFVPRTVQPVASLYTVYVTRSTKIIKLHAIRTYF